MQYRLLGRENIRLHNGRKEIVFMEVKNLLPIGSVVLLKDGTKRLMIFGIKQTDNSTNIEYDYIGVLYPEGNIGENGQFLFNHEDIQNVYLYFNI